MAKRVLDLCLSLLVLLFLIVPMLLVALTLKLTSPGPVLYWSDRVGRNNVLFSMPKFRTMRVDTPTVATHLLHDPDSYVTKIGIFLRKTSLDELPQVYSILKGDMSFVGPRPALYNQVDLIALRTRYCIHTALPGLTGWAQVNGRDVLSLEEKVMFDFEYIKKRSFVFDLYIIYLTAFKVIKSSNIAH